LGRLLDGEMIHESVEPRAQTASELPTKRSLQCKAACVAFVTLQTRGNRPCVV